jgi:hypothetical protein
MKLGNSGATLSHETAIDNGCVGITASGGNQRSEVIRNELLWELITEGAEKGISPRNKSQGSADKRLT